jgi:hypothetical protein
MLGIILGLVWAGGIVGCVFFAAVAHEAVKETTRLEAHSKSLQERISALEKRDALLEEFADNWWAGSPTSQLDVALEKLFKCKYTNKPVRYELPPYAVCTSPPPKVVKKEKQQTPEQRRKNFKIIKGEK